MLSKAPGRRLGHRAMPRGPYLLIRRFSAASAVLWPMFFADHGVFGSPARNAVKLEVAFFRALVLFFRGLRHRGPNPLAWPTVGPLA